jgi:hypothetical protein
MAIRNDRLVERKQRVNPVHALSLALLLLAALAYLPSIHEIGYAFDDWYLMASARAEGPEVFHAIYSVDRPLRAYVLEAAYRLFGENALFYNLSAWGFRVLSALLFWWLLRMLWSRHTYWTFLMALLYVLYPGFLSQPNGIDYQPQMISLALAMGSLGLTVYAFFENRIAYRVIWISLAILLGILYLGLVEYEVGFEGIRFLLLFILVSRVISGYRERFLATIRSWLPYSLILLGFGIWRVFFFQGDRAATDVGLQFQQARLYPLQTLYHWTVQVVQDLFDVMLSAWVIPLSQLMSYIQRWGGIVALLAAGLTVVVLLGIANEPTEESRGSVFVNEALLLGLVSAFGGLIPIAMVNREVAFPFFSRYSLVSSVGVSIFIVALLSCLNRPVLRTGVAAVLVLISILTHHANAVKFTEETSMFKTFWWQVAWRAPHLQKGTTLIANYPVGGAQEDYFIWGPANLIYYPEKQNPKAIQPGLYASILNSNAVTKILTRERQQYDNRKNIITYPNYRNILVLTQPTLDTCVHIIDGRRPEYSRLEQEPIRVIGPFSEIEHVLTEEAHHTPPEIVFGPEPPHGWCYYYQKADLARQRGDWVEVVRLGAEVLDNRLAPQDTIEWMPFLQAYAVTGATDRLAEVAPTVTEDPYIAMQICQQVGSMEEISIQAREEVESLYCLE